MPRVNVEKHKEVPCELMIKFILRKCNWYRNKRRKRAEKMAKNPVFTKGSDRCYRGRDEANQYIRATQRKDKLRFKMYILEEENIF